MDYADLTKEEIIDLLRKEHRAVEDLTHQLTERESELGIAERNLRSTVDDNRDLENRIRDMSEDARRREIEYNRLNVLSDEREKVIDKLSKKDNRPRSINPTQPTFSGKPEENVDHWIYTTEQNLIMANIQEPDRVSYASTYLRDVALQYYRQLTASTTTTTPLTWNTFTTNMKSQFQPANYNEMLLDDIDKLRQTGTVNQYVQQFMYLINQTQHITEQTKIHMFRKGLSSPISAELRYKKPSSLRDATNMAMEFEESYIKQNVYKTGYYNEINNTYRPGYTPNKFNPHYKQNNDFKNGNSKPQYTNNYKYYNKNNKSYGQNTNKSFVRPENTFTKKKEDTYKCNIIIPKTYNKNRKSEINTLDVYEFVTTTALINDNFVEVLFDTGAKQSVIAFETVKKYKIPYHKSDFTCSLGNGSIDTIYGITEPLRVIIHGSICEMDFIILPRHNTLIGLDWFNTVKAHVETYNQTLVFKSRIIPLQTEDIEDTETTEINLIDTEDTSEELDEPWNIVPDIFEIDTISELNIEQNKKFKNLLGDYKDIVAETFDDLDKPCKISKFRIETTSDQPIRIPPYRKAFKEREIIKKEVEMMMKAGIIRSSQSPWAFPVVLIPKPDGTSRFCVDYRKLNAITLQDPFPLPRIDDIFDRLNGSIWFSALDLKAGYWQIEMDEGHICKTAFSTPDGHYEFLRLPFGLKNAPAAFSRIMFQILGDLPYVEIYLDDITIHSPTIEKHLEDIKEVLQRLKNVSLKINLSKCKWFKTSIQILGHIMNGDTIKMNPKKIELIENWKTPKSVLHIQQFLGLCGYYRRFIKDFSKIAAPMYNLIKKETEWNWDASCEESFKILKEKLVSYPILRQPDLDKPFILQTDACGIAIGAILSQKDDKGDEYACCYSSRLLKGAEIHYGITEKECLAVIWAIKLLRVYLYGNRFTVITDHAALQWLINIKEPTGRLARWSIYLQAYQFDILHRPGKKHQNVDAVSRALCNVDVGTSIDLDTSAKQLDPWEDELLLNYLKTGKFLPGISKRQCVRVQKLAENYQMDGEKLKYRKDNLNPEFNLEVPKINTRHDIIRRTHLLGHFAVHTVLNQLKEKYYWKNMIKDIEFIVGNCMQCLRHQKTPINEHPALAIPISGIMDRIGMDLVFGLPETSEGYVGLCVITEALTKYPYAVPIKTKSAMEISRQFFKYITIFGPPKEIITDQGKEFCNSLMDELSKLVGVEHRVTSSYHPRTNGLTEKFNQTLINALKKHTEDNKQDWIDWIPYILLAYRSRIHSVTGFTPYELMFGRRMNQFDNWNTPLSEDETLAIYQRSIMLKKLYEFDVPKVLSTIEKSQQAQIKRQNDIHNIQHELLEKGTKVFVRGPKLQNKLEARYQGPYTIKGTTKNNNYWLLNKKGETLKTSYPLSRLKVVADTVSDEETYEIEEIQDDRTRNGIKEYLVKWKNFPESDNTWVKESNMNALETIEAYKLKKYGSLEKNSIDINNIEQKTIKTSRAPIFNWTLFLYFLFIVPLPGINSQIIQDKFRYCSINSESHRLDLENLCKRNNLNLQSHGIDYTILEKRTHMMSGNAYLCYRKKIKIITLKYFLGNTDLKRFEELETLSREDCQAMIITKKCMDQQLHCSGDTCKSIQEPNYTYLWLQEASFESYHCITSKRIIYGESMEKPVYPQSKSRCLPDDLFCLVDMYTIIWEKDIIHKCPFVQIKQIKMNVSNDIVVGEKILLQLKNTFRECDLNIQSTTEGLFISSDEEAKKLPKATTDMNLKTHLLLADIDLKTYTLYLEINKKSQQLSDQNCNALKTLIRSFEKRYDEHLIISDSKENEIVILNKLGEMIITNCTPVESVSITDPSEGCYEEIKVKYELNQLKKDGYLSNNGIIIDNPKRSQCKPIKIINLPNNNQLYAYNSDVKLVNLSKILSTLNLNNLNTSHFNTYHIEELLSNIDFISEMEKMNNILSIDETELTISKNNQTINKELMIKTIEYILGSKIKIIQLILLMCICIIIIILTLLVILKLMNVIKIRKQRKTIKKNKEAIKLIYTGESDLNKYRNIKSLNDLNRSFQNH